MLKQMYVALGAALAAAPPAQAVEFLVTGIGTPIGLDEQNSYTSELNALGLTQLVNNPGLNASLTGPISVNVFSVGAESLYANTFQLSSFTLGEDPNNFEPFTPNNLVATLALAGGPLSDTILGFNSQGADPLLTPGTPQFGIFLPTDFAGTSFTTRNLWLAFDDQNDFPGDDDDHDDFIILLSVIPEPSSWLTMIAGFGMIGFMLRRQNARIAIA